jgi:crotonobetainyl-CoA:carnitine CoA-transferase CaiB-like acyl-CoA transferase
MSSPWPLSDFRVIDLSTGIAGAYTGKLLADAGAEVVMVESREGNPLRSRTASGAWLDGEDSAIFQFLSASKASVVADLHKRSDVESVRGLVAASDAVLWTRGSPLSDLAELSAAALRECAPHATVVTITPWGLEGPWSDRVTTEAALQALAGAPMTRGDPTRPPVIMGGEVGDWAAGLFAAVGLLSSRWRTLTTGRGELVDVSELESLILSMTMYSATFASIAGAPMRSNRMMNLPAIHRTKDSYVGFMVVTGQQWLDFCVLVDQPQWLDDESLVRMQNRLERRSELINAIDAALGVKTTEEVLDLAAALRVPAAPIGDGATVPSFDQFVARRQYYQNPSSGLLQPDVAHTFSGSAERRPAGAAPALGEHTRTYLSKEWLPRQADPSDEPIRPPFEGLRVADFTANWAGPIIGHVLGLLGADVIHVESAKRPDPMRFNTIRSMQQDEWWEWSPLFQGPNTNKRGLTLDLNADRGRELARELIAHCDIVVENYSPRVMEAWGLSYDEVHAINPQAIMVRSPAFGLSGPWRDRGGYAQTMEMASGLAWLTGWPDDPPEVPNGPMDPIAGTHATIALLLALEHRRRTGEGILVEVPMIGGALNVAAEQVVEYSAYGNLLERQGNRSAFAAPQGAYLTADLLPDGKRDRWVLISVASDEQWVALRAVMGSPTWANDPSLLTLAGRRAAHDEIDEHLGVWTGPRLADDIVELLAESGVPASKILLQHESAHIPQLAARGFWETLEHSVTGINTFMGYPAKFQWNTGRLNRTPAPTLGQHNREILTGILGLSDAQVDALAAQGIIGDRPTAASTAW